MAIELINILSTILAGIAAVYLFVTSNKCDKNLRKGLMFVAFGALIAVAIHSFVEALEAYGYLTTEALHTIMPILVLIGSILLVAGTYILYNVVTSVSQKR